MKHYLINPKLKWYKANLHCHTNNSDGFFTPLQIKELYMKHGYSIVAYSDHEVIVDNSFLTDDKFLAITATEYSMTKMEQNSCWSDAKTIHMNMFSPEPHTSMSAKEITELLQTRDVLESDPHDHLGRVFTKNSIQETILRANKLGFLVQFNHPNWSLNDRDDYINLKGLWGLEIFNYLTDLETSAEYCPNIYDDMLRNGHRLFCTMGDDNHNWQGSDRGSFGGFVFVGAKKLEYKEVFKALKKGCFYSSMGPIIKSLIYDDETRELSVELKEKAIIYLVANNRRFFSTEKETNVAKFALGNDITYFRVAIMDDHRRFANTNAYFLDDLKQ